ncbi:unnamed protein product [Closterium sp. NIES-54]
MAQPSNQLATPGKQIMPLPSLSIFPSTSHFPSPCPSPSPSSPVPSPSRVCGLEGGQGAHWKATMPAVLNASFPALLLPLMPPLAPSVLHLAAAHLKSQHIHHPPHCPLRFPTHSHPPRPPLPPPRPLSLPPSHPGSERAAAGG